MCRIKRYLQSQKNRVVLPCFGKEIGPLVQTNPMQWHHRIDTFVEIFGQTLRGYWTFFQSDYFVKILVIEFRAQSADTSVDFIVADQRPFRIELFRSKREPAAIIVSVRRSSRPKQPRVFL